MRDISISLVSVTSGAGTILYIHTAGSPNGDAHLIWQQWADTDQRIIHWTGDVAVEAGDEVRLQTDASNGSYQVTGALLDLSLQS